MINGYAIKSDNGINILYLYFDFNYEFSSENFNSKEEKIKEIVTKFIKRNKMLFKITAVVLVSGGIIFGNINLNESNKDVTDKVVIQEKINLNNEENDIKNVVEEVKEEKEEDKNIAANTNTIINDNKNINVKEEVSTPVVEVNNMQNNLSSNKEEKKETNSSVNENIVEENKIEEIQEEIEDNKIYVNIKRSNGEILKIELEEYVVGVVGAEMPASFNKEALKAQSIIARTYALKAISINKTLTDNESTQSYKSIDELKSLWGSSFNTYYNKIKSAVNDTSGMYLTYNGTYIEAIYHSTSNGKTEDSINVWGNKYPYLISVDSIYDNTNPSFTVKKDMSYEEVSTKLGLDINIDTQFNILGKTSGNRVSEIDVGGVVFKGTDFRNKLGLRSADFEILKNEDSITFTTYGYGHGVGLSQYGANGMAKNGSTYKEILFHYYPGVSLSSL